MSDRSLHASNGKTWQSLEQLAGTEQESQEFSGGSVMSSLVDSAVSRRGFMTIMSASMALTAAACRRPIQSLVPTVKSNQTAIPGLPLDYATVYSHRNVAYGALATSREGRPIKVKGNELHPSNCGTASVEMQASILALYDPERIRRPRVRRGGGATSYGNAVSRIADGMREAQEAGKQTVIVIDEHCSPSFTAMLSEITTAIPSVSVVMMPAISGDNTAKANQALTGINGELVPDLGKARVIVCVDADPLGTDKLALHHTGRYAARRTPTSDAPSMSKMIVAEAQYSLTGANADDRYRLHPSQLEPFLAALEQAVGCGTSLGSDLIGKASESTKAAAHAAAKELTGANGEAVVLAGKHLSPRAQALALNITDAVGGFGTGKIIDPACVLPGSAATGDAVRKLESDLNSGSVHTIVFAGVNPEYTAGRSFRAAMVKAPIRAAINLYEDETSSICDISIPGSHWLESWGDAVSFDGTMSVRQPLIAPMNDGVGSTEDTLMNAARAVDATLFAETESYFDYVKKRWEAAGEWKSILRDGIYKMSSVETTTASPMLNVMAGAMLATGSISGDSVVMTVPSLAMYDGALSNNAWLQELPDPVTKITWENVALISPQSAVDMGLADSLEPKRIAAANGKVLTLETKSGSVDAPVWVQAGMADNVVAISLGYGRTSAGNVANGVGVNAYQLGAGFAVGYVSAVSVSVVAGAIHKVACSQDHHSLDDGNGIRPVAKTVTAGDVAAGDFSSLSEHFPNTGKDGNYLKPLSITADYEYKGHRWGMVIDMSSCTGCSSCVIACQSENNIPTVGKQQVMLGREMHWMRIDRYYTGSMEEPATVVEPMLCQHCENAPCENVCPVAATTHSPEGLNEMTYNRCVGTRYCLNNCPYKVRRFNFLNFNKNYDAPMDLVFNPDVTMRMRGVMEKCTFCVQRLHKAKWHARDEGRARINDGEAVTACQEACPAGAIIFGDTNDPNSRVSKARHIERGFRVLSDLNVRPQVTYLAKVRNVAGRTENAHHAAAEQGGEH